MPVLKETVENPIKTFEPTHEDAGKELVETLRGPEGELLYQATHSVESDGTLRTTEEQWSDTATALQETHERPLLATGPADAAIKAAETGVKAAKLAWDIIRDNKATAVTTDVKSSVLSTKDTDPLSYAGAVGGESGQYTWEINDSFDLLGKINYITVRIRFEGSYRGQPVPSSPAPPGSYLPSVYFNVLQCTVNFPCTLIGTANLETPTNIGSPTNSDAAVIAHAKLNGAWLFQSLGISIKFRATGTGGFTLIGQE